MKMNVTGKAMVFALMVTFFIGCKTMKVTSDYDRAADFSAYKTFSIYRLTTTPDVNELNAARIWSSIRAEMTQKGYKEDNYNPDLLINVAGLLQNRKYISESGNGYVRPNWGRDFATIKAHDYKDGALIIHVTDLKTKNMVWEGKGTAEITKQPKDPDKAISHAVTKIMNSFPAVDSN